MPSRRAAWALPIAFTLLAGGASAAGATDEPAAAAAAEPAAAETHAPAKPEQVDDAWLKRRWAATDLTALASAIAQWRQEHGEWPADCPAAAAAALRPAPGPDPWGSAYACNLADPPRVISAGPDRVAGTPDDVEYRLDGKGLVGGLEPASTPGSAASTIASSTPAPSAPATDEARATTDRLVWMAQGLESYRKREGRYPVADKAEYLEHWLVPADVPPSHWFAEDGWGREWRYRVTDVGSSYSLSSGGADGRWEALSAEGPRAASSADGDIVVADGAFVRWPADYRPERIAEGAHRAPAPEPEEKEPADHAEATQWRLDRLASVLEKARKATGRYPESDDAERVFDELGARLRPVDGWKRGIDYLTVGGGAHFVLVSPGADGKQARSTEDYARGAKAVGDDVLIRR